MARLRRSPVGFKGAFPHVEKEITELRLQYLCYFKVVITTTHHTRSERRV